MNPFEEAFSDPVFWLEQGNAFLLQADSAAEQSSRESNYHEALSRFERALAQAQPPVLAFQGKAFALLGLAECISDSAVRIGFLEQANHCFTRCTPWPVSLEHYPRWLKALRLLAELVEEPQARHSRYQQALTLCLHVLRLADWDRWTFDRNYGKLWGGDRLPEHLRKRTVLLHARKCFELLAHWENLTSSFFTHWSKVLKSLAYESAKEEFHPLLEAAAEKSRTAIRLEAAVEDYVQHAENLEALATHSSPQQRAILLQEATDSLLESGTKHPHDPCSFTNRGIFLSKLAIFSEAAGKQPLLEEARTCHARSDLLASAWSSEERAFNLYHWARALEALAFISPGRSDKQALLSEAVEHASEAARLMPRTALYVRTAGSLLLALADLSIGNPEQRLRILTEALPKLNSAVRLAPGAAHGWCYLGRLFLNLQAAEGDPEKAPEHLDRAVEYFRRAVTIDSARHLSHSYLAEALRRKAEYETHPRKKARCLARAAGSIATASNLRPDYRWHLWTGSLILWAQAVQEQNPEPRMNLLLAAKRKLQAALKLNPVTGNPSAWVLRPSGDLAADPENGSMREAYLDLARIEALRGEAAASIVTLNHWRRADPAARIKHIRLCPDFRGVEDHPAFREFLQSWQEK